jgi:hypothetical protein
MVTETSSDRSLNLFPEVFTSPYHPEEESG